MAWLRDVREMAKQNLTIAFRRDDKDALNDHEGTQVAINHQRGRFR